MSIRLRVARKENLNPNPNHNMITAYSVSGNVRERTLTCVVLYRLFPVINGLSILRDITVNI